LKCYFNNQVYLVACCYHPPNPRYESKLDLDQLINGVEQFTATNADTVANEYIIVAGDFNTLVCCILETQYGLTQIVNQPTHGDNILDKVFTNRSDYFSASVFKSLLKTRHLSVLVSVDQSWSPIKPKRVKVKLLDLRAHNIDYLRYMLASYDWSKHLACFDIQLLYDMFLNDIHRLISECIPVKYVTIGPHDPPYVTPLVDSARKAEQMKQILWQIRLIRPSRRFARSSTIR